MLSQAAETRDPSGGLTSLKDTEIRYWGQLTVPDDPERSNWGESERGSVPESLPEWDEIFMLLLQLFGHCLGPENGALCFSDPSKVRTRGCNDEDA